MKLYDICKLAAIPALLGIVWLISQSFNGRAKSALLIYDVSTEQYLTPVNVADTARLTGLEKINTQVLKTSLHNEATFTEGGGFSLVITRTSVPTLGGRPMPADNTGTITVDSRGMLNSATGQIYPLEPTELQTLRQAASEVLAATGTCANTEADLIAYMNQLVAQGGVRRVVGTQTVIRLGNTDYLFDLAKKVCSGNILYDSANKPISTRYLEYVTGTAPGKTGDAASCPVLKRVILVQEEKTAIGVRMKNYSIQTLNNISVVQR